MAVAREPEGSGVTTTRLETKIEMCIGSRKRCQDAAEIPLSKVYNSTLLRAPG